MVEPSVSTATGGVTDVDAAGRQQLTLWKAYTVGEIDEAALIDGTRAIYATMPARFDDWLAGWRLSHDA